MKSRVHALVCCLGAGAALLAGCCASYPGRGLGELSAPLPEIAPRPAVVLAGTRISGGFDFGGFGGGSSYYGGPVDGGVALSAFAMPFVVAHGDGNFVDSGAGWGLELGIHAKELGSGPGDVPGSMFLSVFRADLDEPVAGVETPYWIVSAGMRVPVTETRPVVGVWGAGFSYHRFERPQTADLWAFGVFALIGVAWSPHPNFSVGADLQGHVWFPEDGEDGTTFMSTVGATVLF
jgi:hypothetical protein